MESAKWLKCISYVHAVSVRKKGLIKKRKKAPKIEKSKLCVYEKEYDT